MLLCRSNVSRNKLTKFFFFFLLPVTRTNLKVSANRITERDRRGEKELNRLCYAVDFRTLCNQLDSKWLRP